MYIILDWYFICLGMLTSILGHIVFYMLEIAYNFYVTLIKLVKIKDVIKFVIIIP